MGEALGEQQVDQRVEELRVARGTPSGRARSGHGTTLALLLSVLYGPISVPIGVPPMAVDRLLPTQESEDLLELTREIADKELAPRVEEHERAETYPEGLFATLGEAGLLGLPYPEELRRRRAALRGLPAGARGAGGALGRGGRGDQRARAVVLPAVHVRHRGAEAAAARDARRRAHRRLQPVRAPGGVGRGGPARARPRRSTGGLPHHRHQGLDHPRRRRRLLRPVRPHRRGLARRLVLPRARAGRGSGVRAGPRRRWVCTRSPRRRRTGTAPCSTPTG